MKRIFVLSIMTFVLAMTGIAWGAGIAKAPLPSHQPTPITCTVQGLRPFASKVWDIEKWERKQLPPLVLRAYKRRLNCAPPFHKEAMKRVWHRHQEIYFEHRQRMRWLDKYRHYIYPDGSRWAVPYPIAWCESGGDYFVGPSGAYGLIPPFPQYMSPKQQDEVAFRLFQEQGEGPWAPYEAACAYR